MAHLQFKIHNWFYNSDVDICPVSHIALYLCLTNLLNCITILQQGNKNAIEKWKLLDNEKCHLYAFYGI